LRRQIPPSLPVVLAVGLLLYMAASALWSIVPGDTLARTGKLAILALLATLLLTVPLRPSLMRDTARGTAYGLFGLAGLT
ncbi:hypothetical protein, partial [Leifsonia sp. SIMBA_070]|uniref:hypothetical protein n=1 Tax=Leifsonia sp. SIMBA_070 TaxID=3085810 RepID=UPI00397B38AF